MQVFGLPSPIPLDLHPGEFLLRSKIKIRRHSLQQILVGSEVAADTLGISIVYLDKLVKRGSLRATRLGRRVLFTPADIERFVEQRREESRR
jgi:excisionase family DNA binding protein